MSRFEMQACLARLYTDESFRRLSRLDPVATLDQYTLTPEERNAITAIDGRMLDVFARSLSKKRKSKFARAYSSVFALNAQQANRLWDRYHQIHPSHPNRADHQDLVEFGHFLEESVRFDDRWPPYAADMARYERVHVQAGARQPSPEQTSTVNGESGGNSLVTSACRPVLLEGIEIASFGYDVTALEEHIASGSLPDAVDPADCFLVFKRLPNVPQTKVFRVTSPSMDVLKLCDGTRAVRDIVETVEQQYGVENLNDQIVQLLDRLIGMALIRITGEDHA